MDYRVIQHSGTKGQKWGVRRYQNPDGTRTTLGKMRRRLDLDLQPGIGYKIAVGSAAAMLTAVGLAAAANVSAGKIAAGATLSYLAGRRIGGFLDVKIKDIKFEKGVRRLEERDKEYHERKAEEFEKRQRRLMRGKDDNIPFYQKKTFAR